MKTTSFRGRARAALTTLIIAVALPLGAVAQDQPRPEPPDQANPPRENRRMPAGGGGLRGGQGPLAMEQVLTEAQRESLRHAMESQREKMRELQEQIRAARQAMMKAALADEFKEKAVKAKAIAVAKLEAEVAVIRLKAFSEVQPALSAEQLEKVFNPPQPRAGGPDNDRPQARRGNRPLRAPDGGGAGPRDSQ